MASSTACWGGRGGRHRWPERQPCNKRAAPRCLPASLAKQRRCSASTGQKLPAAGRGQPEQCQQPREEEEGQPEEGWDAGQEEGGAELSGWEQEHSQEEEAWEEGEEEGGWGQPEEAVPGGGPPALHNRATALRPTARPFVPSWASL